MKTVIAAALGECVHAAGISNFLRLAEKAGWRTVFLGPAVPIEKVLQAARGIFLSCARTLARMTLSGWQKCISKPSTSPGGSITPPARTWTKPSITKPARVLSDQCPQHTQPPLHFRRYPDEPGADRLTRAALRRFSPGHGFPDPAGLHCPPHGLLAARPDAGQAGDWRFERQRADAICK